MYFPPVDCYGIVNGISVIDSCGVCQPAIIYNYVTHVATPLLTDTSSVVLGPTEMIVLPDSPMNSYWNASCSGCTDPTALNYDSTATIDDGSCIAIVYGCTDPAAINYFPRCKRWMMVHVVMLQVVQTQQLQIIIHLRV